MKRKFTLLLSLATLASVAMAQTCYINIDGTNRSYIKYVPADLGENRPLLVSMHGMNQDAGYQKGMMNIEHIADTAKFAVIFPEGINRGWDISGDRDINFVLRLIDEMAANHSIDKNRVYLSGFSMGGMFTYHAMTRIADRIAAFAPISGYPMGGQTCVSTRPIPIIHTHGTGDDVVTFDGVQRSLDGWIEFNNCSSIEYKTEGYRYSGCTRHQWGPGDDGAEVVLIELANKGHWVANDGFFTGEEIWNFCKRYSLADKKPNVHITYPTKNSEIMSVGTADDINAYFEATATDTNSDIVSMSIYNDNVLAETFDQNKLAYRFNGLSSGTHLFTISATNSDGVSVSRAMPLIIRKTKKNLSLTTGFAQNCVPKGWITYDSRTIRKGLTEGLNSGNRVLKFSNATRDFDYAMYINNISGSKNKGYAKYGSRRGEICLHLSPGTYQVSFQACNYDMPQGGECMFQANDIISENEIFSSTFTTSVNIGGSTSNPFSGIETKSFDFVVNEDTFIELCFYAPNVANSDLLIANIGLKKVSSDGIQDAESAESEVIATEYYDIMGRKITASKAGVAIRVSHFADGTSRSQKIVIVP